MPGLHNELVLRVDIAEDDHLHMRISEREYLANGRHPAADQTIKALFDYIAANLRNILIWVIRPSIAAGIDRLRVLGLHRSDERIPTKPRRRSIRSRLSSRSKRSLRRRGFLDLFYIGIVAAGEKLVGKQIAPGKTDVFHAHAQMRGVVVGKACFGTFGQNSRTACR